MPRCKQCAGTGLQKDSEGFKHFGAHCTMCKGHGGYIMEQVACDACRGAGITSVELPAGMEHRICWKCRGRCLKEEMEK